MVISPNLFTCRVITICYPCPEILYLSPPYDTCQLVASLLHLLVDAGLLHHLLAHHLPRQASNDASNDGWANRTTKSASKLRSSVGSGLPRALAHVGAWGGGGVRWSIIATQIHLAEKVFEQRELILEHLGWMSVALWWCCPVWLLRGSLSRRG